MVCPLCPQRVSFLLEMLFYHFNIQYILKLGFNYTVKLELSAQRNENLDSPLPKDMKILTTLKFLLLLYILSNILLELLSYHYNNIIFNYRVKLEQQ